MVQTATGAKVLLVDDDVSTCEAIRPHLCRFCDAELVARMLEEHGGTL